MKRFIKKHIGFVIAIGVSTVVVLALLVMALVQNSKMQMAAGKLQAQKSAIESLNKAKPSPAQENLEMLQADTVKYTAKLESLHRFFGRPYERALDKFCEELGVSTPDFRKMFRAYWEQGLSNNRLGDQIYELFVADGGLIGDEEEVEVETGEVDENGEKITEKRPPSPYWNKEKWDRAMRAFVSEAQKYTLEAIGGADSASAKELLMFSVGVPRTFGGSEARCKAYANGIQTKLVEIFADKGVGLSPEAQNFGFTVSGNGEPLKEDMPKIGNAWDIISDLGLRIANSDLDSLESFSMDTLSGADSEAGFRLYRFQIEVTGTLPHIRKFAVQLAEAYEDSRVYLIRRMALMKDFDEAQILVNEHINRNTRTGGIGAGQPNMMMPMMMTGGGMGGGMQTGRPSSIGSRRGHIENFEQNNPAVYQEAKSFLDDLLEVTKEEENVPVALRKNYGRPVIGIGQRCTATFVIDYAVYVTDELELTR